MRLLATLAAALLIGCAVQPPAKLATPSGRPEVTIQGVTKKQVADEIVASALSKGSQVKSVSEYAVVLGKRAERNTSAAFLYGSRYDQIPEIRITLNMVDVQGGVRIYARGEVVTNPGSAYERVNDVTPEVGPELQTSLADLTSRLARKR